VAEPDHPEPVSTPPQDQDRLDSWKEIASYLKRDVRTAQRWEKKETLPVYRHRHDKFSSVYAFRSEIDEWRGQRAEEIAEGDSSGDRSTQLPDLGQPHSTFSRLAKLGERLWNRQSLSQKIGILTVLLILIVGWIYIASMPAGGSIARLSYESGELRAHDKSDRIVWKRPLPAIVHTVDNEPGHIADVNGDGRNEVLACVPYRNYPPLIANGEVYCFNSEGKRLWQFAPNDTLRFGNGEYGPPWAIEHWSACTTPCSSAIAIAAHHFIHWPSMLILLDGQGQNLGKFVNSGWIVTSQWLQRPSGSILVAGGISNSRSMGMMAVLSGKNVSGCSPEEAGSEFECDDCPPGGLLRYFVFPRSELNIVTSSQCNRVNAFSVFSDHLVAYSMEVDIKHAESVVPVFAAYEFSLDLELRCAYFDDRYWDIHSRLEAEGRINHSRADCPDRGGPRLVRSWDPKNGWRDLRPVGHPPTTM
jgi:hypothetical protein